MPLDLMNHFMIVAVTINDAIKKINKSLLYCSSVTLGCEDTYIQLLLLFIYHP